MPVRVDVVYSRTADLGWSEQVACPKCSARWKASVRVVGRGEGKAAWGLGSEQARERAGLSAFSAASEEGERLIRQAKCPACGHRQRSAFSLVGIGGGFIVGLFVGALGAVVPVLSVVGCLAMPVTMVAIARWDMRRNQREADERVVFERIEEVPAHLVGGDRRQLLAPPVSAPPVSAPAPLRADLRDDPELDFDRAWQQPAEVAGEPQPDEGPAGDLELELDLDRSWNKKS